MLVLRPTWTVSRHAPVGLFTGPRCGRVVGRYLRQPQPCARSRPERGALPDREFAFGCGRLVASRAARRRPGGRPGSRVMRPLRLTTPTWPRKAGAQALILGGDWLAPALPGGQIDGRQFGCAGGCRDTLGCHPGGCAQALRRAGAVGSRLPGRAAVPAGFRKHPGRRLPALERTFERQQRGRFEGLRRADAGRRNPALPGMPWANRSSWRRPILR